MRKFEEGEERWFNGGGTFSKINDFSIRIGIASYPGNGMSREEFADGVLSYHRIADGSWQRDEEDKK